MTAERRVVIVGAGENAQMAYEYFTHDSDLVVAGFAVEAEYLTERSLLGLPVVSLDEMTRAFPPADHRAFVAISSTKLNRVRRRLYRDVGRRGYRFASYVSSRAFVWRNVTVGENAFILEGNVIQHMVTIGDNVVLWSGNHVGHRTVIEDDCFIASHVVISGYCRIGARSFVGVNACFGDGVTVGEDCVIGAGAVVVRDAAARGVYLGNPARGIGRDSFVTFKVEPEDELD